MTDLALRRREGSSIWAALQSGRNQSCGRNHLSSVSGAESSPRPVPLMPCLPLGPLSLWEVPVYRSVSLSGCGTAVSKCLPHGGECLPFPGDICCLREALATSKGL